MKDVKKLLFTMKVDISTICKKVLMKSFFYLIFDFFEEARFVLQVFL